MDDAFKRGRAIQRFTRDPIEFDDAIRLACGIAERKYDEERLRPAPLADRLVQACHQGQEAAVRRALSEGADPNSIRVYGTPLGLAVSAAQSHSLVECLLVAGADPNLQDQNGWSPLFIAASNDDHRFIRQLIEAGARVNDSSALERWTPLMNAASLGCSRNVIELLAHGGDPFMRTLEGYSVIDLANINRHPECVRVLEVFLRLRPPT